MKTTGILLTALMLALFAVTGCAAGNMDAAVPEATGGSDTAEAAGQAAAVQTDENLTIAVKPKTVTTEMEDVTLLIVNNTGKTYSTDYVQKLELLTDGVFQEVPLTTEAVSLALLTVPDGEMMEYVFDFANHYAPLSRGTYRITKTFSDDEGNLLTAACEFDMF